MKCSVQAVGNGEVRQSAVSPDPWGPFFGIEGVSPEAYGPIYGQSEIRSERGGFDVETTASPWWNTPLPTASIIKGQSKFTPLSLAEHNQLHQYTGEGEWVSDSIILENMLGYDNVPTWIKDMITRHAPILSRRGKIGHGEWYHAPTPSTAVLGVGDSVEDIADIRLISGESVDSSQIQFDPDTYHFSVGSRDITRDIYRADAKRLVPGYSDEIANRMRSMESGDKGSLDPLTESTTRIFTEQIFNDPLAAPLGALDKATGQIFGSSGIQTILVVGGLAFAAYMIFKSK